jgi:CheY-like chemotaxis protein
VDTSSKKILIIEDDQFLREFYQELLQAEGYNIDIAGDGDTGLAKAQVGGYNLILLDIMLPKKDGIQILGALRSSPPTQKNGPIVVLTNLGQDNIIKQCFALGAEGYLVKSSMDPDQVLTEDKTYLQK